MAQIQELKVMSKEEAIEEVKKIFKGNKRFISYCEVMIASTDNFVGIESTDNQKDNWNWEKLLRLSIQFGYNGQDGEFRNFGYKSITYRKGNKRFAPENTRNGGNTTSNIHEFSIFVSKYPETEEYRWDA